MYIEIKDLGFRYKNVATETVKNFSLDINEGEIISILGPSGSGKSTVLRLIAGLEKPNGGLIKINNQVVFDAQTYIFPENRGASMVFQDYALFPHLTVEKNIKYGLRKLTKQQQNQRVAEVLELVNLQGFKKRYPHELSGGQQQRVALARAIAPQPAVLLLDEPFSNLDADLQIKIRNDLKKILKKAGITTIFVTHDQEDAKTLADRIVYFETSILPAYGGKKAASD